MQNYDRLFGLSRAGWFTPWATCVVLVAFSIGMADAVAETPKSDAETQVRVRELIYVLRQYRPFEREDEWSRAIRELTAIGRPALPELLLELKNTEREQTLRAMLFALRVIDDPRALPFVIDELPKAERLSNRFSDYGLAFLDPELNQFMQDNQNQPRSADEEDDGSVFYGRPINEILGTLVKLSRTKRGDDKWNANYWYDWWKSQVASGKAAEKDASLILEPRKEDLVERGGLRRYGVLFPTGPDQFLSPAVEVQLERQSFANVPSALDMESGRLYAYLEGVSYGSQTKRDRSEYSKWLNENRIDVSGSSTNDIHLWLIDNARWESLDKEIASDKPLDIGREAFATWERDKEPGRQGVGTFLFTTGEGSRGVMRVQNLEKEQATKITYRLWNRRELNQPRMRQAAPEAGGSLWSAPKVVLLKEPDFDNECLLDFESGEKKVLPRSVFERSLTMKTILKTRGAIFGEPTIAQWAEQNGIDLATGQGIHLTEGGARPPVKIGYLVLLNARESPVSAEGFAKLSVAGAREILDRTPNEFRIAYLPASQERDAPASTYVFNTKAGVVGILRVVKVQENASAIEFEYKLADDGKNSKPSER